MCWGLGGGGTPDTGRALCAGACTACRAGCPPYPPPLPPCCCCCCWVAECWCCEAGESWCVLPVLPLRPSLPLRGWLAVSVLV